MEQIDLYKECLHTCPHLKDKILDQAIEDDMINIDDLVRLYDEAEKVKGC